MYIRDIIADVADIAEGKTLGDKIREEAETTAEETEKIALMLKCYNAVQRLIGFDYEPLKRRIAVSGGRKEYSDMPYIPIKITAAFNLNGREVSFKEYSTFAVFESGAAEAEIICAAKDGTIDSAFEYENSRVGKFCFVYGTLRDYCLAEGRYDEAGNYESRFLSEATRTLSRGRKIKPRKDWGL